MPTHLLNDTATTHQSAYIQTVSLIVYMEKQSMPSLSRNIRPNGDNQYKYMKKDILHNFIIQQHLQMQKSKMSSTTESAVTETVQIMKQLLQMKKLPKVNKLSH